MQQGAYAPANGIEQVAPYGNNAMYSGYPPSPYAQQGGQVYQQRQSTPYRSCTLRPPRCLPPIKDDDDNDHLKNSSG